jgi:signal transduction histidine kinase
VLALDAERMRRAVINLADNARHAMLDPANGNGRGKTLSVRTRFDDDVLEIAILDTGPGMASDVLENVFEPLYSTRSFGVGLGLPIVKQIVEAHGGEIEINSELNEGTAAILRLPAEDRTKAKGMAQ